MTASERPYWRSSILNNRFFNNEKSKDTKSKTKTKQEDILHSSILHSARLKKNLEESRKAFFNMEENQEMNKKILIKDKESKIVDKDKIVNQIIIPQTENAVNKRFSNKKISFKIKKSSSIYRRSANNSRPICANSVAELTSRFNKLVTTKTVIDAPKLSKLVNKVNSLKNKEDSLNYTSKTKLKLDQEQQQIYFIRRPSVKRKSSVRKLSEFTSVKSKPEVGKVKATIEIFETITSRVSPTNESKDFSSLSSTSSNKPKVPEKKFGPEVIDIVNKNRERCTKIQKAKQEIKAQNENVFKKRDTSMATNALAESVKIIIAQTLDVDSFDDPKTEIVQVVNIPIVTKRCDSKYETLNVSRVSPQLLERRKNSISEEIVSNTLEGITESDSSILKTPNKSFLWSRNMPEYPQIKLLEELEELYDKVDQPTATNVESPKIPPRPNNLNLNLQLVDDDEKIYEDVLKTGPENYEYCTSSSTKYEELDDGYEYCQNIDESLTEETDNIYETLPTPKKDKPITVPPRLPPKKQQVPLPPRPPSRNPSFYSQLEGMSNCYESIYNASSISKRGFDLESNYESIDECLLSVCGSAVSNDSSDDKSNSLYVYGKCQSDRSDRSASDRTDEWVDLSDDGEEPRRVHEMEEIVVVREKPKVSKRNSGWSQKCRDQRKKAGPAHLCNEDGHLTTGRMRKQPPLPPRRRHVADTVYITSSSAVYLFHQDKDMDDITRTLREYAATRKKETDQIPNDSVSGTSSDTYYNREGYSVDSLDTKRRGSDMSDSNRSNSEFSSLMSDAIDSRTMLKSRCYCGLGEEVQEISFFIGDTDSDHIYESLCDGTTPKEQIPSLPIQQTAEEEIDVYDSFDSDSDGDYNIKKDTLDDIANAKLPQLPVNQTSVSTIAKTLRKNFTKSFHKMTKRRSEPDNLNQAKLNLYQNISYASTTSPFENKPVETGTSTAPDPNTQTTTERVKKDSIFNKFRRSMTFVSDTFISDTATPTPTHDPTTQPPLTTNRQQRPKSTFYLTTDVDIILTTPNEPPDTTRDPATTKASKSSRPSNPPPPAPNIPEHQQPTNINNNNNQLYADTGVFKPDGLNTKQRVKSNTNWYADVGLYQQQQQEKQQQSSNGLEQQRRYSPSTSTASSSAENSGNTVASSCVHERVSLVDREEYYNLRNERVSHGECGEEGGRSHRWLDEPLYQFYDAAILESEYKNSTQNFDYDGYEEVGRIRPSAMELIAPIKNSIGSVSRTLWCEVPEVVQSAVLSSLSEIQQKIQEAKFEMLTSEASYLHSLNVLVDHFVKNIKHSELLTDHESKLLFGNIFAVRECSEKLLCDLEKCWQDNILLTNICDIINKHAEQNFHVYVTFCENQIFLDSTLNKLKERLSFSRYLEQLERSAACQSLKLNSFLLLPMQRITRWRLLVDAVLKRLVVEDTEYLSSRNTMATLTKIAQQCNEAARSMERTLEMQQISKQLEFGKGVPPVDILLDSGNNAISRFLIKSGPLTQMVAKTSDLKVTFGKRFTKISLYLFLFNDILLITKARSKDNYLVLHYCYRNFIEVNIDDSLESLPLKNAQGRHLIFLTVLENHEEKLVELLLSCESISDKERWLEAILPPKSENPDEIIYENWDCPQVTAVHNYIASQPDEMSLVKGDVINVNKKLTDGWFHGEKISDNQIGWFPSNYTTTITNQHVRARNLKMRYRLLAFSTNYILNNQ